MRRGVTVIIEAVLISMIATIAAVAAYSWAIPRINEAFDTAEGQSVRMAMTTCSDKIVETARTGTASRCIIPADRGKLSAQTDGIYYSMLTTAAICDPTVDWATIDPAKHIEFRCGAVAKARQYELRWRWPNPTVISGDLTSGGFSGFSGEIGTEPGCPWTGSPPYPPCPNPTITFAPTIVNFSTVTVFVEFEFKPGAAGKNLELIRTNVTADKVDLKVNMY